MNKKDREELRRFRRERQNQQRAINQRHTLPSDPKVTAETLTDKAKADTANGKRDFIELLCGNHSSMVKANLDALRSISSVVVVIVSLVGWLLTNRLWLLWIVLFLFPVAVFLIARNRKLLVKLACAITAVAMSLIMLFWLGMPIPNNLIVPYDDPTPPLPPGASLPLGMTSADLRKKTLLFSGGAVFATSSTNPMSVIAYNYESLLSIQRTPKGASISGQFFGADGKIVAVLENNKFFTNNNVFRIEKCKHSLVIHDDSNQEVVNLRYVNPSTFTLTGKFRLPNGNFIEKDHARDRSGMSMGGGFQMDNAFCWVFGGPPRQ